MYSTYMKRGVIVFLPLLMILLIMPINICAFGVSTPYIKDDTLLVNPGKIYEYTITLQNNGEEGYYVDINYSSTDDVASLEKTEYYVPADTYNTTFSFKLDIPANAAIGETYALGYSAKPRVNGSGSVSMGVEMKRGITILVTDGTTSSIAQDVNTQGLSKDTVTRESDFWNIGKYLVLAIILFIVITLVWMLWRLSRRISSKVGESKEKSSEDNKPEKSPPRTKYTISEAVSLEEVKRLLQNINDEAFEVSEIKNLFRDKLLELTTSDIAHNMRDMTRKEILKEIDRLIKK